MTVVCTFQSCACSPWCSGQHPMLWRKMARPIIILSGAAEGGCLLSLLTMCALSYCFMHGTWMTAYFKPQSMSMELVERLANGKNMQFIIVKQKQDIHYNECIYFTNIFNHIETVKRM